MTMSTIGWIFSGLFAAFIVFASAAPKLMGAEAATASFDQLGWPQKYILFIGLLEIGLVVLYLAPATSLPAAVLLTGLLGGAMASQLRVENPLFSLVLFSIYLSVFMWGGLWFRTPKLRELLPLQL